MTARPFLELPRDRAVWPDFVRDLVEGDLARARELAASLTDGTARGADDVITRWNEIDDALASASAVASLVAVVHPDKEVRELAEHGELQVRSFANQLNQNGSVFEVLSEALGKLGDVADEGAVRLLRLTLRDFRRAGVDRDEATRSRLRELVDREIALGQEFSRIIREDVRSIRVTPDRLSGLPEDYVAAHAVDEEGLVTVTTDYPDFVPFRRFAHDAGSRRALVRAFLNRGWPANDATLRELLAVRAERAALLGYGGWPDFDAEVKMIGSGAAIAAFIDQIEELARPGGERDRGALLERLRRDRPDAAGLDGADSAYYLEALRREVYDVDAQEVRRYLPFGAVRAGLLDVTGRLFGLRYQAVDSPTWHEDVAVYDVYVEGKGDGEPIGRIYLDLFPREGKFKHAAQYTLAVGRRREDGSTRPEGALLCNFNDGLMEHSEVVTLFHEFGHLVHHVVAGKQTFTRFSGVATEWDFVEAPSQMLEEWAWDANVLQSFARNGAGEPIPTELVARMRAAKEFAEAANACTQMFYSAISYYFHDSPSEDFLTRVQELQRRYDVFDFVPDTHFYASFGHLEGYTSGYYTYMWSQVIAKDLFSAFDTANLFEPTVARRYRDVVLAAGGSRDAADLVEEFLGRPYNFDAFARWLTGVSLADGPA